MNNLLAQVPKTIGDPFKGFGPLGLDNKNSADAPDIFVSFLSGVVGIMTIIASIWVLFRFILAGYAVISAGGDKAKLESARGNFVSAIIGLVIILSSIFVLDFVGDLIGIPSILNLSRLIRNIVDSIK